MSAGGRPRHRIESHGGQKVRAQGRTDRSRRERAGGELSPWADIIGPCYNTESFGRVLAASKSAVSDAVVEGQVLHLRTSDGHDLFPAFQVRAGHVHPDLWRVLDVLRTGIDDPWTWAQWLNTADDTGETEMDRLWEGDLASVLREAGHDAAAWRS